MYSSVTASPPSSQHMRTSPMPFPPQPSPPALPPIPFRSPALPPGGTAPRPSWPTSTGPRTPPPPPPSRPQVHTLRGPSKTGRGCPAASPPRARARRTHHWPFPPSSGRPPPQPSRPPPSPLPPPRYRRRRRRRRCRRGRPSPRAAAGYRPLATLDNPANAPICSPHRHGTPRPHVGLRPARTRLHVLVISPFTLCTSTPPPSHPRLPRPRSTVTQRTVAFCRLHM